MKILLILGVPLLLVIAIVTYLAWPWLLIFIGIHSEPNPPRPEITYGEFPFRLEYVINGERKVIQDTLICEFDGFGADEANGKYRKWNDRLASGNSFRQPLLEVNGKAEISYYPGIARYFMGDLGHNEEFQQTIADSIVIERGGRIIKKDGRVFENDGRTVSTQFSNASEFLDKYHIKLISWDSTQPIKNTFSK
ncbi:hypothetical protein [Paenibacillus sedimenti]|uniref:hypothetical protein n=1 Tax=Paenibacillus sedimenti TaxID=2770274 RepID=UPI00289E56C1|nr:hypothetical protein [Paenibacillus sedimenti]